GARGPGASLARRGEAVRGGGEFSSSGLPGVSPLPCVAKKIPTLARLSAATPAAIPLHTALLLALRRDRPVAGAGGEVAISPLASSVSCFAAPCLPRCTPIGRRPLVPPLSSSLGVPASSPMI